MVYNAARTSLPKYIASIPYFSIEACGYSYAIVYLFSVLPSQELLGQCYRARFRFIGQCRGWEGLGSKMVTSD
jgi:hypothetical protein